MVLEKCGNCERTIGKLETAHVWKGETVCQQCHDLLSVPASKPVEAGRYYATAAVPAKVGGLFGTPFKKVAAGITVASLIGVFVCQYLADGGDNVRYAKGMEACIFLAIAFAILFGLLQVKRAF